MSLKPLGHFLALRRMLPGLKGLAIMDRNAHCREDSDQGGLVVCCWGRYEIENCVVSPAVLQAYVTRADEGLPLFDSFRLEADDVLGKLMVSKVFGGSTHDPETWRGTSADWARLLWEAKTAVLKLSDFAEEFFRKLVCRLEMAMLLGNVREPTVAAVAVMCQLLTLPRSLILDDRMRQPQSPTAETLPASPSRFPSTLPASARRSVVPEPRCLDCISCCPLLA